LRVLVVDDETLVALTLRDALQELGCEVVGWANSISEAERLAAANPPDLVLMDIRLKGQADGVASAAKLRQRYSTPIVFMTAFADEQRRAEASQLSPVGVLEKPFLKDDLEKVLREAYRARDQNSA
jgi:two-component system, response regulator PdtaR